MHCYKGFVSFDSPKSGNLMIPWKDQEDYPTHTTSWLSLHHLETFSPGDLFQLSTTLLQCQGGTGCAKDGSLCAVI